MSIGETRDPETADSSMDAAELGTFLATLHANSASSSLTRLMDMKVRGTNWTRIVCLLKGCSKSLP